MARTASGIAARGMAYSISRNRVLRAVTKTSGEWSVKSRLPISLPASRLIPGVSAGATLPTLHMSESTLFESTLSSNHSLAAGSGCRSAEPSSRELFLVSAVRVCGNQ